MFQDRRPCRRDPGEDPQGSRSAEKDAGIEFYVTDDCNGCGLCKGIAPDFFDCIEYTYSYFVSRQPRTMREVELLRNVSSLCALDAIRETIKVQA